MLNGIELCRGADLCFAGSWVFGYDLQLVLEGFWVNFATTFCFVLTILAIFDCFRTVLEDFGPF